MLIQEIVDVRREPKEDMVEMRTELKTDIAKLDNKIIALASDVGVLRMEVHTNQITFIHNHADLPVSVFGLRRGITA